MRALNDVDAIRLHIAADSPIAAERMYEQLIAAGDSLTEYAFRTRPVWGPVREMVSVRPYVIRCVVLKDGGVTIRSVLHAAQRR